MQLPQSAKRARAQTAPATARCSRPGRRLVGGLDEALHRGAASRAVPGREESRGAQRELRARRGLVGARDQRPQVEAVHRRQPRRRGALVRLVDASERANGGVEVPRREQPGLLAAALRRGDQAASRPRVHAHAALEVRALAAAEREIVGARAAIVVNWSSVIRGAEPEQVVPHPLRLECGGDGADSVVEVADHGGVGPPPHVVNERELVEVLLRHLQRGVHAVRRPAQEEGRRRVVGLDDVEDAPQEEVVHVRAVGLARLRAQPRIIERPRAALRAVRAVLPQVDDRVGAAGEVGGVVPIAARACVRVRAGAERTAAGGVSVRRAGGGGCVLRLRGDSLVFVEEVYERGVVAAASRRVIGRAHADVPLADLV